MTYLEFEARARELFGEVPAEYRDGVDGLEVERRAVPHPSIPEVYTLGECRTETYPTEFGGAGEVRSFVVLYYGSFLRLSRLDEEWDWEEEIWETITHEIRHHLESLASDDALEEMDYAEDQNFLRREGREFDPFFYRAGEAVEPGVYEVDGDIFVERTLSREEERAEEVPLEWGERALRVPLPAGRAEVHYLTLDDLSGERGEVVLVLLRRRGLWESLRGALAGRVPEVAASTASTREG